MTFIITLAVSFIASNCGPVPQKHMSERNQALMSAIRRIELIMETNDISGLNLEMTALAFYNAYRAGYTMNQILKYSAVNTDSLAVRLDEIMKQHEIVKRMSVAEESENKDTATLFYWICADVFEATGYMGRIDIELQP